MLTRRPSPARRLAAGAAIAAVLLTAGCSGADGSPRSVADDLAEALAGGDFAAVPLSGATAAEAADARETSWAALAELPVTVEVTGTSEPTRPPVQAGDTGDGPAETATAVLELTWDLPGEGPDLLRTAEAPLMVVDGAWTAAWDPAVLGLPAGQVFELTETFAPRADILDRSGTPLVTARPVWRFGIDKTQVDAAAAESAARALAAAAGLDADAYAASVAAAGERAFVELISYRQTDPDGQALDLQIDTIPGAAALPEERVLGSTRTFAQPLLGTVGPVTAEMIEQDPQRFSAGEVVGRSGLQAAFDERLTGTPDLRVAAYDPATGERTALLEGEPVPGEALTVTLSTPVQQAAEDALADLGPASALVAIDHTTGDVLAMAVGPGSNGASTALAGQYAPGSTFKVASALALLRDGLTPDSPVTCTDTVTVDGRRFGNVSGYPAAALGEIPLRTAIAQSCNTAFIGLRDAVPQADLARAAADLGIGAVWDMPVTAFSGSVPAEAASQTEHAANLIGQGTVLASPTAMAVVAASIGHGGTVVPRVVAGQEVPAPDGMLAPEEAAALRDLMRATVTQGSASMLADNPGPEVMAKTGTAEFGTGSPPRTHAWMIALQGNLAVAVFVEDGALGSTTAGPILDAFLTSVTGLAALDSPTSTP